MTSIQRIIKYLAIALAIFIIVMIASAFLSIVLGLTGLARIWGWITNDKQAGNEMNVTSFANTNISAVNIEIDYADLTIKTGENFKVETTSEDIICKQSNQQIQIKEKNKGLFSKNVEQELILYIPEDTQLEKVEIDAGAGKIDIENLTTEKLTFELGAGETKVEKLNVSKKCEIEGGAGKINIKSGVINNLDLDMGVGETVVTSTLKGKNEINAGVGRLDINLSGEKENYEIKANKGLGFIKIDGQEMVTGQVFGNGTNRIEVDGGIGNIDIEFEGTEI